MPGTTAADCLGERQPGDAAGPGGTLVDAGRYGDALSFNGTSSLVRVADSASLDLTSGMTLSAWIQPRRSQSGWRTILQQQTDAYFLNASNETGALRPRVAGRSARQLQYLSGPTANPVNAWTHVALTYDGTTCGCTSTAPRSPATPRPARSRRTTSPLWIGGNSPYGEYFHGLIDEVRVYNRALTPTEIQTDMNTPVPSGS